MADTCVIGSFPHLEDDIRERARAAGFTPVGSGGTFLDVLRVMRERLPGVLLLYAMLPGLDASRMEETLDKMALYRRPAVVYIISDRISKNDNALSREWGKLFPAIDSDFEETEIRKAVYEARCAQMRGETLERAMRLMEKMGVPQGAAREYLAYAAALTFLDASRAHRLSAEIYPAVAARFSTEPRRASETMRRAIERAWMTGDIERQYALFGNTIDEEKGKPTTGALLATAAEILRLRGDIRE